MQALRLGAHIPAAFHEPFPAQGTVPLSKEDQIPVTREEDRTACYFPESMVMVPQGEVFIRGLCDLIKDCPEWNVDHLISICISQLYAWHGDAGLAAVLTDVLTYSSGALDNLVDHMYPQGAKPLQEIVPPETALVEHISMLVNISDREIDLVKPCDAQHHCDMCAEHGLLFEGVSMQFVKLQAYADFLDPSQAPLCHLFRVPPSIGVWALWKDVHNYDEWKRDLCLTIVLDCNE